MSQSQSQSLMHGALGEIAESIAAITERLPNHTRGERLDYSDCERKLVRMAIGIATRNFKASLALDYGAWQVSDDRGTTGSLNRRS